MYPPYYIIAFFLGTIIGSFLNVVVLRYGARKLSGRSRCPNCSSELRWFELIPVLSYLAQSGRCRRCQSRISFQYIVVEIATGLIFAVVLWKNPNFADSYVSYLRLVLELVAWSVLIGISFYDARHKIIPDGLVATLILVSAISYFLNCRNCGFLGLNTFSFWLGPLSAVGFASIWYLSKGRAMGLGDAKLVLPFSWLLSSGYLALSAIFVGFWLAALLAFSVFLFNALAGLFPKLAKALPFGGPLKRTLKHLTIKSEVPLAPFLILGLLLIYITGVDVTGLSILKW